MKLVIVLLLLFVSTHCSASLVIAPAIFEGNVDDFAEVLVIELYNSSSEEIYVEVDIWDLYQQENGQPQLRPAPRRLVLPKNDSLTIAPNAKALLELERAILDQAIYQAAILKTSTKGSKSNLAQAVAVLFIIAQAKEDYGELVNVACLLGESINDSSILVTIKNEGSNHFKTEGLITLTNKNGENIAELNLEKGIILPGATRSFSVQIDDEFVKNNLYWGKLQISLGEKKLTYDLDFSDKEKDQSQGVLK